MIKQAGNPVNKLKLQSFKSMTNPDYANKAMTYSADRLGLPEDQRQDIINDGLKMLNNVAYGQDTIPDDVLANPGQALRNRGLDKAFGQDAVYNELLRLKRNGGMRF